MCPMGTEGEIYKNAHGNIAIISKSKKWKTPKYPLIEE